MFGALLETGTWSAGEGLGRDIQIYEVSGQRRGLFKTRGSGEVIEGRKRKKKRETTFKG